MRQKLTTLTGTGEFSLVPVTWMTRLLQPKLVFVLRVSLKAVIPTRSGDNPPHPPPPLWGRRELIRLFGEGAGA